MLLQWFRLLRVAGLTTIISNLLAALISTGLDPMDLARQMLQSGTDALWIGAASTLIYFAGMVWNDVADVERDRLQAPQRPLPSGRISYLNAWLVGLVAAILAIFCAAQVGWRGFYAGGFVLLLALSYDFGGKQIPWLGSLLMAATRASHAIFALLILGPEHFDLMLLQLLAWLSGESSLMWGLGCYPLLLGLYIFGLTLISELEHRRSYRWELLVGSSLVGLALVLVIIQALSSHLLRDLLVERQMSQALPIIVTVIGIGSWALWRLGAPLYQAIRLAQKSLITPVMIRGLSGIILFDALLALSYQPLMVIPIVMLLLPFKILGRIGRMD